MKFEDAVKLMEQGKKVRRKTFTTQDFVVITGLHFYWSTGEPYNIDMTDILAKDWEVFEENKTLSDGILSNGCIDKVLVKMYLKEYLEWLHDTKTEISLDDTCVGKTPLEIKAKEIFGEELTGE